MKARRHNKKRWFVRYNDNRIGHVTAGPEYGQPWRTGMVWEEIESSEFASWVEEIQEAMLRRGRLLI